MSFHNGVQESNQKSILPVKSFLKYKPLYQKVFEDILEKEYPEKKKDLSLSFHIDGLHSDVLEKNVVRYYIDLIVNIMILIVFTFFPQAV